MFQRNGEIHPWGLFRTPGPRSRSAHCLRPRHAQLGCRCLCPPPTQEKSTSLGFSIPLLCRYCQSPMNLWISLNGKEDEGCSGKDFDFCFSLFWQHFFHWFGKNHIFYAEEGCNLSVFFRNTLFYLEKCSRRQPPLQIHRYRRHIEGQRRWKDKGPSVSGRVESQGLDKSESSRRERQGRAGEPTTVNHEAVKSPLVS